MNRNEILLLINTVVLVDKQGGRYKLSDDIVPNIREFCEILGTMYEVDTRLDIDVVSTSDVVVKKAETYNSPCSYSKYINSLIHIFGLMKKHDPVLEKMMETGWTEGRLSSTLKTFFLIYVYGGVDAIISYINIFYSMVICPKNRFILPKFVSDNVTCLTCRSITQLKTFMSGVSETTPSTIFINYVNTSKQYQIPLSVFPDSFYMDCTNSMIPIMLDQKLISKTFYNGNEIDENGNIIPMRVDKSICETRRLKSFFGKKQRPSDDIEDIKDYVENITKNIDNVTKMLATEAIQEIYSYANLDDKRSCQIVNPFNEVPNFADIINSHFIVLRKLKHGHCDTEKFMAMEKQIEPLLWRDIDTFEKIAFLTKMLNKHQSYIDHNIYVLNYKLRKCYFNYILYKFRYEFLAMTVGKDDELIDSNIYFEQNNFSTIFNGSVISDNTSQGVVWKLDIKGLPIAVLKYSDGPRTNLINNVNTANIQFHNIIHELVVGLVLNELKEVVPNFMYTWGGFICSPPRRNARRLNGLDNVKYDYTFGEMCTKNRENSQIMVLNEFVEGQSMESMLETGSLTLEDIKHVLFQVACALRVAQVKFSFQHNDLHTGNVLIKTLRTPHVFNYDTKTITSIYIPVIIDYGYATLKYNYTFLHRIMGDDIVIPDSGKLIDIEGGSVEDMLLLLNTVNATFTGTLPNYKKDTLENFIEDLYKDITTQI